MYKDQEKGKKIGEKIDLLEKSTREMFTMMNTDKADLTAKSRALIQELAKEEPHKGRITGVAMSIDLKETPQKKVRKYPVPLAQQDAVKEEIERLLQEGIIEPSNLSFASPAFLIGKRTGE
ncbi:hypothetical protein PAEPH01_1908 [Pancytospora epiphaga]|nr:hypothetical protein PAEPH01_1908 [Pancytospora epiphaga]